MAYKPIPNCGDHASYAVAFDRLADLVATIVSA
jgi:hypothetical protein